MEPARGDMKAMPPHSNRKLELEEAARAVQELPAAAWDRFHDAKGMQVVALQHELGADV